MSPTLVQIGAARPRLPEWARRGRTHFESLNSLKRELRALNLHTVCESARCPNIHECFHRGAATFMILGNTCTRGCGFCAVPKGRGETLDREEPANVARMAAGMKLRYVVLTSVNRDDLEDGGSRHFGETVMAVRSALPHARVEALTPDFEGHLEAVARVLEAGPHVFNHNMETVPRLYRRVRPQADYRQSLRVLEFAARAGRLAGGGLLVKSGFMVGLGESESEVHQLLRDLRDTGTDIATIGQYLQPTRRNLPVAAYLEPRQFDEYRDFGLSLGFKAVFSGPLVRSSYMADAVSEEARSARC
ncbi:MAG TPA: lipoyl synthase [Bryobacteraceae bacterium]|nr:lipoyl synthase [Bryobacteraceae bacterium]